MPERMRTEKRISGWVAATAILLVVALILSVVGLTLGGSAHRLQNPDGSAQYATEHEAPLLTATQAYTQLQQEAMVLLANRNNALPLQQTVDCLAADAAGTKRAGALRSILIKEGYAVGNGTVVVLLTQAEPALLQEVSQKKAAGQIGKIVLLWDTDKAVQPDAWKGYDVDAVLWTGGVDVAEVAAILVGVVPSGALPGTGAYGAYPSPAGSIYTGYKYYETRYEDYVMGTAKTGNFHYREQVAYPFGFGLSYTSFAYSGLQVAYDAATDNFTVTVTVTNTGNVTGRKILQVYAQSPYTDYDREKGVEKPAVKLVGYAKTDLIAPDATATLTLQVARQELASYDAKGAGAYVMTAGDYYLTVADDSHSAVNNILAAKGYTVESTQGRMDADGDTALTYKWTQSVLDDQSYRSIATNRFDTALAGVSRQDWEGTLSRVPATQEKPYTPYTPGDYATVAMPTMGADNDLKLYDLKGLAFDHPQWQTLLDQLTFGEMVNMIAGSNGKIAPVVSVQAPGTGVGQLATPRQEAFLSAAFDSKLMYAIGWWAGEEAAANGQSVLYCFGDAFEDSYLTGTLRTQQAKGISAQGVNVLLRNETTAAWETEQAAREQYLQAYRYTVQQLPTAGVALAGPANEFLDMLRLEWGSKGMAVATDTPATEGVLAGLTILNGQDAAARELAAYEKDPVLVAALRQACHYNLYALANSAAMDGIGANTVVKMQQSPWVMVCWILAAVCLAAAVVLFLLGRKRRSVRPENA